MQTVHNMHTVDSMEASSEMLGWLAKAMTAARMRAGKDLIDIAVIVRRDQGTIKRWERAEHLPRNLDSALAAYARATGLSGPRAIWELALQLWREDDEGDASQRVADAFDPDSPRSPDGQSGTDGATENPEEAA